ncbi:hypothetical protein COU74_01075 [Candidatus Peregrinibacteria bacterium CG10_big_fil_rev_8_21_14_0_10_36_19]|nr:MAG: hypothetical protein COU74_01075 [Candidatus Peregrinibacteria bacterium CG10_big_fil_rev_8_21_14_0_10_36_19]
MRFKISKVFEDFNINTFSNAFIEKYYIKILIFSPRGFFSLYNLDSLIVKERVYVIMISLIFLITTFL